MQVGREATTKVLWWAKLMSVWLYLLRTFAYKTLLFFDVIRNNALYTLRTFNRQHTGVVDIRGSFSFDDLLFC
jgi:hypothetical protein